MPNANKVWFNSVPKIFHKNVHYFWFGLKALPKLSTLMKVFWVIGNDFIIDPSWIHLVLGFEHPHFQFLRNLNMMHMKTKQGR